ncbi:hypothetical protein FACS189426_20660 [Bacteroidia bacterium]|nr:hypothetical protein FACS189426_20660 [Bacteroidia bacterium]
MEMIYLQTSKGIYEPGEDLWFKAYILDAQVFYLSGLSQTLYLQMISESDGEIAWQEKYPIENGIADGHVYVSDTLPDGDYFLEAYTQHSFFADSTEMNAVRKVKIQKDMYQTEKAINQADSSFRFETFPEGGNLVSGIPAKLAFKATDGHGYPMDVAGSLYENDVPLIEFKSAHAGMGFMQFTPLSSKNYQIRLNNGDTFSLPEIYPQGMSIQLTGQNADFLEFTISQNEELPKQAFYLAGQIRGIVACVAKGIFKGSQKVKIPLKEFSSQGIAEFTLFNKNLLPVAERLVYVHPEKKLHITATTNKKVYGTRENARVKIKVTDENGQAVRTHLGVSVFDGLYNNPADPANILTQVYLSSQIRGKIYDPAYYFNEKNKDRKEAMDLLLLTQGWRRYVWAENNLKPKGQAVVSDEITGIQTVKSKQIKSLEHFLQVSDVNENAQIVTADSTGYFVINTEVMKNLRNGYLYLKPLLPQEFKTNMNIDDPFSAIGKIRPEKETFYPFANLNDTVKEEAIREPRISFDGSIALDEVTITAKAHKPFRDKYMGRLDNLAQRNLGPWVCEHGHLENYLPGYTCHHDPQYCPCPNPVKEHNLPVIGKTYYIFKPKYFPDQGRCTFIVEDSRYITYEGPNYTDEELLKMNNLWRVKGYYGVREFYQPDDIEILSSLPDARNTLLWAPSVVTDEQGEATINFYCSDINTGFIGRIEGLDGAGLLGAAAFDFRVIKRQSY